MWELIFSFELYPNLNNGKFTLAYNHQLIAESRIEIYNMEGEKVYDEMLNKVQHDYEIELNEKASKLYLYRSITPNGSLIGEGKFMIEQ